MFDDEKIEAWKPSFDREDKEKSNDLEYTHDRDNEIPNADAGLDVASADQELSDEEFMEIVGLDEDDVEWDIIEADEAKNAEIEKEIKKGAKKKKEKKKSNQVDKKSSADQPQTAISDEDYVNEEYIEQTFADTAGTINRQVEVTATDLPSALKEEDLAGSVIPMMDDGIAVGVGGDDGFYISAGVNDDLMAGFEFHEMWRANGEAIIREQEPVAQQPQAFADDAGILQHTSMKQEDVRSVDGGYTLDDYGYVRSDAERQQMEARREVHQYEQPDRISEAAAEGRTAKASTKLNVQNPQEQPAEADNKPLTETEKVFGTNDAQETPATNTQPVANGQTAYGEPVLMKGSEFNELLRQEFATATSVEFTAGRTVPKDKDRIFDASAARDGSVIAWQDRDKVIISSLGDAQIYANEDSSYLFAGHEQIERVDFGNLNTSRTVNLSYAFADMTNLKTADFSKLDVSNARNISNIFLNDEKVEEFAVGEWNTTKIEDASGAFARTTVEHLPVEKWNTEHLVDAASMFRETKLSSLNLSQWDTRQLVHAEDMMYGSRELSDLQIPDFTQSQVRNLDGVLAYTGNASSVDLNKLRAPEVVTYDGALTGTIGLDKKQVAAWTSQMEEISTRNINTIEGTVSDVLRKRGLEPEDYQVNIPSLLRESNETFAKCLLSSGMTDAEVLAMADIRAAVSGPTGAKVVKEAVVNESLSRLRETVPNKKEYETKAKIQTDYIEKAFSGAKQGEALGGFAVADPAKVQPVARDDSNVKELLSYQKRQEKSQKAEAIGADGKVEKYDLFAEVRRGNIKMPDVRTTAAISGAEPKTGVYSKLDVTTGSESRSEQQKKNLFGNEKTLVGKPDKTIQTTATTQEKRNPFFTKVGTTDAAVAGDNKKNRNFFSNPFGARKADDIDGIAIVKYKFVREGTGFKAKALGRMEKLGNYITQRVKSAIKGQIETDEATEKVKNNIKQVSKDVLSMASYAGAIAAVKAAQSTWMDIGYAADKVFGLVSDPNVVGLSVSDLSLSKKELGEKLNKLTDRDGRPLKLSKQEKQIILKHRAGVKDMFDVRNEAQRRMAAGILAQTQMSPETVKAINTRFTKLDTKGTEEMLQGIFKTSSNSIFKKIDVRSLSKKDISKLLKDAKKLGLSQSEIAALRLQKKLNAVKKGRAANAALNAARGKFMVALGGIERLAERVPGGEGLALMRETWETSKMLAHGSKAVFRAGLAAGKRGANTRLARYASSQAARASRYVAQRTEILAKKAATKTGKAVETQLRKSPTVAKQLDASRVARKQRLAKRSADRAAAAAKREAKTAAALKKKAAIAGRKRAKQIAKEMQKRAFQNSAGGKVIGGIGKTLSAPFKALNKAKKAVMAALKWVLIVIVILVLVYMGIMFLFAGAMQLASTLNSVSQTSMITNVGGTEKDNAEIDRETAIINDEYNKLKERTLNIYKQAIEKTEAAPEGRVALNRSLQHYGIWKWQDNNWNWVNYPGYSSIIYKKMDGTALSAADGTPADNMKDILATAYVIMGEDFWDEEAKRTALISDLSKIMNPDLETKEGSGTIHKNGVAISWDLCDNPNCSNDKYEYYCTDPNLVNNVLDASIYRGASIIVNGRTYSPKDSNLNTLKSALEHLKNQYGDQYNTNCTGHTLNLAYSVKDKSGEIVLKTTTGSHGAIAGASGGHAVSGTLTSSSDLTLSVSETEDEYVAAIYNGLKNQDGADCDHACPGHTVSIYYKHDGKKVGAQTITFYHPTLDANGQEVPIDTTGLKGSALKAANKKISQTGEANFRNALKATPLVYEHLYQVGKTCKLHGSISYVCTQKHALDYACLGHKYVNVYIKSAYIKDVAVYWNQGGTDKTSGKPFSSIKQQLLNATANRGSDSYWEYIDGAKDFGGFTYDESGNGGSDGEINYQWAVSLIGADWNELYGITSIGNIVADIADQKGVFDYLISCGFSPAGACGIMGNIQQESSFNPNCGTGSYYGLCQWGGSRLSALKAYGGAEYNTVNKQMEFMVQELSAYPALVSLLQTTNDPALAAKEFCALYERPVGGSEYYQSTISSTHAYYQQLSKRVSYAQSYATLYIQ